MTNGYNNRILRINLSLNEITVDELPKIIDKFLGGKGLGAYFLTRELSPGIDPLGSENKIIIATGPLQGTSTPLSGRYCAVTKSPLTGLFLDSQAGGTVGPELAFAGYDVVIIEGVAQKDPVYITIINDDVQIRNAKHLQGLTTLDKEAKIQEEHGADVRVMSIGLAGENKVKFACITSESFRNLGRGGLGAVFGSKNLLAIAIKGIRNEIQVANPEKVKELTTDLRNRATTGRTSGLRLYRIGTPNLVSVASNRDQIPVKNFQAGTVDNPAMLEEEAINQYTTKKKPCYKCPISCSHIFDEEFPFAKEGHTVAVPEYETLGLIGTNCDVDFDTVIEANYLANMYSLDTISLGNTIGFFMECSEKDLVPKKFRSEKVQFGDKKGLIDLIHKIAKKQGVGKVLSEGTKFAAETFDQNTYDFAIHVKGLELAAWDPRGKLGLGLSYATAAVGASHLRGWPSTTKTPAEELITEPLVESLINGQDLKIINDSLIMCHFTHSIIPASNLDDGKSLSNAITGYEVDIKEIAQNIWSLTRYFNMREFSEPAGKYDQLPHRLLKEPLPSGCAEGSKAFQSEEDFQNGLRILYKLRRCKENGDLLDEEKERIKNLISVY
jgi:aldehyde:ferredoxin oxidoreductase